MEAKTIIIKNPIPKQNFIKKSVNTGIENTLNIMDLVWLYRLVSIQL